ncbi:type I-E CRISPR-associated protein Cse1/CasA [Lactobacillus sp. ESL0679]|uniref:type I-E CRISPR-associated protein Cse1/CasA n=1 Tax=Lactobacillus sp. ESL0679 TaxID=2983209 RepID=UPI0023FA18E8|nr:type I-E CRISPR-associated protein Cse1/CasA [Lactobacillus sp. ESL0679]MDF7682375.1 type I-E CRISPR-associated protein Cse1/CasA [Lactobacillus sp. ESL0679]
MIEKDFNLITDSWLKVIDQQTGREKKVSLIELFKNAQNYRQLAGDMRVQDLAIIRLLLAILTTVYSRFDADGKPYEWLEKGTEQFLSDATIIKFYPKNRIKQTVVKTWQSLYQKGHFTEIVTKYLEHYADKFAFFGEHPFYQVTKAEYDELVPANKAVAKGTGTVSVKQINRRISESNNTPALFAPKAGEGKNQIAVDELARWLITYQSFTGVTDKTKIKADEKFSVSPGWLYKLNPVFAQGKPLFETLMLNLVLFSQEPARQRPVWEYASAKEYVSERQKNLLPNNIAELYTSWSRILHIEWDDTGEPTIFSAGLPKIVSDNAMIEPMTVWKYDKKTAAYRPAVRGLQSLSKAMWRNFGNYVNANKAHDNREPGIVVWLRLLKEKRAIPHDKLLTLASVDLIDDGNATSQSPVAEVTDDMSINADVLFDENDADYWPAQIEAVIEKTQTVGSYFWQFARDVGEIRGFKDNSLKEFANRLSAKFYYGLNQPFKDWLAGLTNHDERGEKVLLWEKQLKQHAFAEAKKVMDTSSSRDVKGILTDKGLRNIFTINNYFKYRVNSEMKKE